MFIFSVKSYVPQPAPGPGRATLHPRHPVRRAIGCCADGVLGAGARRQLNL